jgi:hypothetical protein
VGISTEHMLALIVEGKHRPFDGGVVYTLGRQTMAATPAEALEMFRALGANSRIADIDELNVDRTTDYATKYLSRQVISDVSFFRMLGFDEVKALDISDFEGAEIVLDLNRPVPADLEATCDLLVDGSTLDNIFDPATALKNINRMLRPGGRCLLINLGNASLEFTGMAYTMFNPLWFFDYFVANDFEYCDVYVTAYADMSTTPRAVSYMISHEHAMRKYDAGFIRPISSLAPLAVTVVAEKGSASTWDRLPTQHAYRPESEWKTYEARVASFIAKQRRPVLTGGDGPDIDGVTAGWLRVKPDGVPVQPRFWTGL